jgi:phosphatidylglycerophosphatase A
MSEPPAAAARKPSGALGLCARILATGFGSGYAPFAPGTAGSAVGLLLYWPLQRFGLSAVGAASAVGFVLGTLAADRVARETGLEDPSIVVVDEIVGMWISLAGVSFSPVTAAAGFVLFRIMDVVKPWPARDFERLHGGLGIMADDVMAGVYANLVLRLGILARGLF